LWNGAAQKNTFAPSCLSRLECRYEWQEIAQAIFRQSRDKNTRGITFCESIRPEKKVDFITRFKPEAQPVIVELNLQIFIGVSNFIRCRDIRGIAFREVKTGNGLPCAKRPYGFHAPHPVVPADSSDQPFSLKYSIGLRDISMRGLELITDNFDRRERIAVLQRPETVQAFR